MASALVLADDGRREGGRWKRGSVEVGIHESVNSRAWQQRLMESGVVLDFAPELADDGHDEAGAGAAPDEGVTDPRPASP